MATTMVTVGESETPQTPPREPRSRGSILAAVGLGAGLALGALFTGGGPTDDPTSDTVVSEPDAAPTTTIVSTTTTDVVEPRLATLVPGLLDVLVASGVDLNGAQTVTTWELADRTPSRQSLPWGNMATDASRTWLAVATESRWLAGTTTLWVGNTAYMEPVPTRLSGEPVWHNRFPGRLAWIDVSGEQPTVVTADLAPGTTASPRTRFPLPGGGQLLAWSDSGFLIRGLEGLELREESGEVLATTPVISVVGVGRNFVAVLDTNGVPGIVSLELPEGVEARWGEDCHHIRWSENGIAAVAWCGYGSDQRFEFWGDPVSDDSPLFATDDGEFVDVGFTSNGIPYAVTIDPIRPTSTVLFYNPADGSTHELSYPGRIEHLSTVAG